MVEDGDDEAALRALIETEIPEGRLSLENSSANLERVAAYCEANYAQSDDKKAAFEETKRFVVQSLASVAYQVNTIASALLQTLDLQGEKIAKISSQVHNVEAIIAIHKEKVARREIGLLTANKCVQKQPKIVARQPQEWPQRYQRTSIDYSILDEIGHGVKSYEPPAPTRTLISRTASTVSGGSAGAHYPVFPNYELLLPKANINSTLSRSTGAHYRTPQIASTPTIDPQRLSNLTQLSNYARVPTSANYGSLSAQRESNIPLPPPQLTPVAQYRLSSDSMEGLPPPPGSVMIDEDPLPPPPPQMTMMSGNYASSTPVKSEDASFCISLSGDNHPSMDLPYSQMDWIPKVYIEKAVALYDYDAEKPDELTLRENNVVYVLRKNDDGWYEGVLNGCTGLFPGNYVQAI